MQNGARNRKIMNSSNTDRTVQGAEYSVSNKTHPKQPPRQPGRDQQSVSLTLSGSLPLTATRSDLTTRKDGTRWLLRMWGFFGARLTVVCKTHCQVMHTEFVDYTVILHKTIFFPKRKKDVKIACTLEDITCTFIPSLIH